MKRILCVLIAVVSLTFGSCETFRRRKAEKQIDTAMQRKMDQLGREIEDVGEGLTKKPHSESISPRPEETPTDSAREKFEKPE